MSIFLAVLALIAHCALGWYLAPRIAAIYRERQRKEWPMLDPSRHGDETLVFAAALVFPILMAAHYGTTGLLRGDLVRRRIDRFDPVAVEQQNKDAARRIAELERELGIGGHR